MKRFSATLEPVSHGGLFVVVPAEVAERAGLVHGARVRGTVNGAAYRSSLMKYSGVFHMGVHKATLSVAEAREGERVSVTIERDDEPLPTDVVPDDLALALAAMPRGIVPLPVEIRRGPPRLPTRRSSPRQPSSRRSPHRARGARRRGSSCPRGRARDGSAWRPRSARSRSSGRSSCRPSTCARAA